MFSVKELLCYILLSPIFGILILVLLPNKEEKLLKLVALNFSFFSFIGSLILMLWFFFQKSVGSLYVIKLFWLPILNLNVTLSIDVISIFFLLLTTLLIPLCILTSWNSSSDNLKEFLIALLILDFVLIVTCCVLDLLLFCIFFESVLIPMFLIVSIWRARERTAAYYFFLYTLLVSVLMLIFIFLYIYIIK